MEKVGAKTESGRLTELWEEEEHRKKQRTKTEEVVEKGRKKRK